MKLYHTTSESLLEGILADGFPNGKDEAWSVRLSDRRPVAPPSPDGEALLLFDIPEEKVRRFELDELGTTARVFAVPGKVLNAYPVQAVLRYGQPPPGRALPPPSAERPPTAQRTQRRRRRRHRPKWPIALAALALVLVAGAGYAISRAITGDDDSSPAPPTKAKATKPAPARPAPRPRPVDRSRSKAVGTPTHGRLVNGVPFPAAGKNHFTWDVATDSAPNPRRRRYATDYVVRAVLRTVRRYRARHPGAPKVGIADLSRRRGGDFGNEGHENGLAVDVLYPRSDGGESEAGAVEQVDGRLAQALLNALVKGGARTIVVDPRLGLTGPDKVVKQTASDARMHVRFRKRS